MTTVPNQYELNLRRIVPAEPQRVFDAWTSAEALVQWWGPPGGRCSDASVDLRVGGSYYIDNELADGSIVTISGEFVEVREPWHLEYTWIVDPGDLHAERVTVEFASHEHGTEVTITHQRIPGVEMMQGHEAGWHACLRGLEELVS